MKNYRPRAWFPKAKRELYALFRTKPKRGLKVSTLWLCVTMTGLLKTSTATALWPKRSPRLGAMSDSGQRRSASSQGGMATRRIRASRSASPRSSAFTIRLRGFMQITAPVFRGSNGADAGGVESVGLHLRGQANLGERGWGVQVERGMRTPTRSTPDFSGLKG